MNDKVVVVLPGLGSLELTREQYDAVLRPIAAPAQRSDGTPTAAPCELVTAKEIASRFSLPLSCIYEYAKVGRIPCVRAGKHVRFNVQQVLTALNSDHRSKARGSAGPAGDLERP